MKNNELQKGIEILQMFAPELKKDITERIEELEKQNESLKDMINKFISGEYSKEKLVQEYQVLIDKKN